MSDFLFRLVETARGAPPGLRADVPATVVGRPLEIDEEIASESTASSAGTPVSSSTPIGTPEPVFPRLRPDEAPTVRPVASLRPARIEPPTAGATAASVPLPPPELLPMPEPGSAAAPASAPPPSWSPVPASAEPPPLVAVVARRPDPRPPPPSPSPRRRAIRLPTPGAAGGRIGHGDAAAPEARGRFAAPVLPVAPAEEVVRISIGRIEVRTVPPAPPPATAPVPLARPRQSLDDHLAARDRRRR